MDRKKRRKISIIEKIDWDKYWDNEFREIINKQNAIYNQMIDSIYIANTIR